MSPEVIDHSYSKKCDLWSCGVILYTMLSGRVPFNGHNTHIIFGKIRQANVSFELREWHNISPGAKDLIRKLLQKDPKQRISAKKAANHPWIQKGMIGLLEKKQIHTSIMFRLMNYEGANILKQASLRYIASHLINTDELTELQEIFVKIDKNGDGKLGRAELSQALAELKLQDSIDIQEIMKKCDILGTGNIDYTEFITAALDWDKLLSNSQLIETFKVFDSDGNGKISLQEIANFIGEDLRENALMILKESDTNGDGVIDINEFIALVSGKHQIESNLDLDATR